MANTPTRHGASASDSFRPRRDQDSGDWSDGNWSDTNWSDAEWPAATQAPGRRSTDDDWSPAVHGRLTSSAVRAAGSSGSVHGAASPRAGSPAQFAPAPRPWQDRPAHQPGEGWSGASAAASRADVSGDPVPPAAPRRGRAAWPERGLSGWLSVLLLIVVTAIGAIGDEIANGAQTTAGLDIAMIVGAFVAILVVRRRSMFAVVVSPPLIYAIASFILLYVRGGLSDRKVVLDAAANWLVYGFPAIAGATAVVLIIAGIRLLARR